MGRIPLWLKIVFSAWLAVWIPYYRKHYGGQNFLWFCDLANFILCAALWMESRRLFSWQAVSILVVQIVWCVDLLGRLATGVHWFGASQYMFDPKNPLVVRLLSLFHAVTPILIVWALWKLGYDRRGFRDQCIAAWIVLPISYALGPEFDLNWVWGPFYRQQHVVPPLVYLAACMVGYPLLLYLPTHLALARLFRRSPPAAPAGAGPP